LPGVFGGRPRLASNSATRAVSACTCAHSAWMSASFSACESEDRSGSRSIPSLNQAPRSYVKRFVDASRRAPTNTGDEQIPAEGFRAVAAEQAAVGRRALDAVAADLAKARERMLLVAQRGTTRKTAAFVLACAERHAGPGPLPLPTRTDMASYLGLRIESVSRALAALRRAGAVAVVYRTVFLRDRAVLVRLSRNGGARPGGQSAACGSRDAAAGGAATPG
jgi:DNA-binding transcriptional ArsR family regulator